MDRQGDVHRGKRYKCLNCGFVMEVLNPCHNCGEGDVRCPFCGEHMRRKWE